MAGSYTREERLILEAAVKEKRDLICPACGAPVSQQPVQAPAAVSYVRRRVWLMCSTCHRHAAVDS